MITGTASFDLDWQKEAEVAYSRIKNIIRKTPLEYSHALSRLGDCQVYLKLENMQLTGSFKLRGATNFVLDLSEKDRNNGVVTVSSGNHAAALTYLLNQLNTKGTIYLPENVSEAKRFEGFMPLSVAVMVTSKILPACASVGVQLNAPVSSSRLIGLASAGASIL